MITQLYKDSDSDTYGRRGRQYRSRSLGFVPPPLGGAFGGVSGNPPQVEQVVLHARPAVGRKRENSCIMPGLQDPHRVMWQLKLLGKS